MPKIHGRYGLLRRYVNLVLSPKYSFNSVACFVLRPVANSISLFAYFGGTVASHKYILRAYIMRFIHSTNSACTCSALPRKQQGQALEPVCLRVPQLLNTTHNSRQRLLGFLHELLNTLGNNNVWILANNFWLSCVMRELFRMYWSVAHNWQPFICLPLVAHGGNLNTLLRSRSCSVTRNSDNTLQCQNRRLHLT